MIEDTHASINKFVAAAATMYDLAAYQDEYLDQLTTHRRIVREVVDNVHDAAELCIKTGGHKDPEIIKQLATVLSGAGKTLAEMADVAELLRAKGAAIATVHKRVAEREAHVPQ